MGTPEGNFTQFSVRRRRRSPLRILVKGERPFRLKSNRALVFR